jgi:hypothetical protein
VADKLGVSPSTCPIRRDARSQGRARHRRRHGCPRRREGHRAAKARIAELLDIEINSVEQFKKKTGLVSGKTLVH